jgi:hypothetical protein
VISRSNARREGSPRERDTISVQLQAIKFSELRDCDGCEVRFLHLRDGVPLADVGVKTKRKIRVWSFIQYKHGAESDDANSDLAAH